MGIALLVLVLLTALRMATPGPSFNAMAPALPLVTLVLVALFFMQDTRHKT